MVQAPILHVNGDDPEACVRVMHAGLQVPAGVRQGRGDRPRVLPAHGATTRPTSPLHAAPDVPTIEERARSAKRYIGALLNRGDLPVEEAEQALQAFRDRLGQAFEETMQQRPGVPSTASGSGRNRRVSRADRDRRRSGPSRGPDKALTRVPDGFAPIRSCKRSSSSGRPSSRDRSTGPLAEALAFGSLLLEGLRCG